MTSKRFGNENLTSVFMLRIIKEYRKFLLNTSNSFFSKAAGISFNNDQALSTIDFLKGLNKASDVNKLNKLSSDYNENELNEVKDLYIYNILDNTLGGYFIKDMLNKKSVLPDSNIDTNKYFSILNKEGWSKYGLNQSTSIFNETDSKRKNAYKSALIETLTTAAPEKTRADQALSLRKSLADGESYLNANMLITPVSGKYVKSPPDNILKDPKFLEVISSKTTTTGSDGKIVLPGNYATPVYVPEPIYTNKEETPSIKHPSLGAIIIKDPRIGLPAKNSDHLNIFFNGIPAIELSRCTPYISIAVVTNSEENKPNNINNVTFMRFVKANSLNYKIKDENGNFTDNHSLVLDENIGIRQGRPDEYEQYFDAGLNFKNETDISLMDIFTAPQTMANANINKDIDATDYRKSLFGQSVLEPIMPMMTLSNLSIDISGMGVALFSSKVGSISLKLHDRSRLADISQLVAANQFGSTKMIIEFGWSHPDGDVKSNNIIGQYLNCLRDRGIYTVKASSFNFSGGNTVDISIGLACYGQQTAKAITAAAGTKMPINVFKESINKINSNLQKKYLSQGKTKRTSELKEVRHLMKAEARNSAASNRLIEHPTYMKLLDAYNKAYTENTLHKDRKKQLLNAYAELLGIQGYNSVSLYEKDSKDLEEFLEGQKQTNVKDTIELLYGKLYALKYDTPVKISYEIDKSTITGEATVETDDFEVTVAREDGTGETAVADRGSIEALAYKEEQLKKLLGPKYKILQEREEIRFLWEEAYNAFLLYAEVHRADLKEGKMGGKSTPEEEKITIRDKEAFLFFLNTFAASTNSININVVSEFLNPAKVGECIGIDSFSDLNALEKSKQKKFNSMGRIMMSFIGHPLAVSGMFDEVQMVFYPFNQHAAGARVHTTASLPIEYDLFKAKLVKKMIKSSNITVTNFFSFFEKEIIRDKGLEVYGINGTKGSPIQKRKADLEAANKDLEKITSSIKSKQESIALKAQKAYVKDLVSTYNSIDASVKKSVEIKYVDATQEILETMSELELRTQINSEKINKIDEDKKKKIESLTSEDKDLSDLQEKQKKAQRNIQKINDDIEDEISLFLEEQYSKDGRGAAEPKFVLPNISIFFETITVRDPLDSSAYLGGPDILEELSRNIFPLDEFTKHIDSLTSDLSKRNDDVLRKRTICRIHVYDEKTSASPRRQLIQSLITEGNPGKIITKAINKTESKKPEGSQDREVVAQQAELSDNLNSYINTLTAAEIKEYIKRGYPSITYGANNSTVQNISVSSNVSDNVSQVIQIASYAQRNNPQESTSAVNDLEELTVVPATVSFKTFGMPFIFRGNQIYIDFGTNTTLDNIYTVKSVKHSISAGKFETDVSLIFAGQGDSRSTLGDIRRTLKVINNTKI